MKWYNKKEKQLNYDKPIVALNTTSMQILLPWTDTKFQWYNLTEGRYTIFKVFDTVLDAIVYLNSYNIVNADLVLPEGVE